MMKLPKPLSLMNEVEKAELKVQVCEMEIEQGKEGVYDYLTNTYKFDRVLDEDDLKGKKYSLNGLIIERNRIYKKNGIDPLPF
jgi:hypothetical protein